MKRSEMSAEERDTYDKYVGTVRDHIAEEHRRWSEGLFKLLTLANTGGIVVVAGLISSVEEFRESVCLRLILTFLVLGLIANLGSIAHEFFGVKRDLKTWDDLKVRFKDDGITKDGIKQTHTKIITVTDTDYLILWLPAVFFFAGCATGLVFLWS